MKPYLYSGIFVILSLVLLMQLLSTPTVADEITTDGEIQLPKIFDWSFFKQSFHRIYPSLWDELARKKLFIANGLKVFAHNLAFKLGITSYYLSVNKYSDKTPQELKAMHYSEEVSRSIPMNAMHTMNDRKVERSDLENVAMPDGASIEALEQELVRIIRQKLPGHELLAEELQLKIDEQHKRIKRSPVKSRKLRNKKRAQRSRRQRNNKKHLDVQIDDFRSIVDYSLLQESDKYVERVPSTNINYEPLELASQETDMEVANVASDEIIEPSLPEDQLSYLEKGPDLSFIKRQLSSISELSDELVALNYGYIVEERYDDDDDHDGDDNSAQGLQSDNDETIIQDKDGEQDLAKPKDEIYLDWRDTGCLSIPRDQGVCGCCYAFGTVALMEYWHCRSTGELVPFSEQYMINCGVHMGMAGCSGGNLRSMGFFVMDWGIELLSNYPFKGQQDVCPYAPDEWEHAGYMKPKVDQLYSLMTFDEHLVIDDLKTGPLIISISLPSDFLMYGGSVHEGHNCRRPKDSDGKYDELHIMLLVGHGIEDGKEYWLLRNSWGPDWGESGYVKFSKKAKPHCIVHLVFFSVDFNSKPSLIEIEDEQGDKKKSRKLRPSEDYINSFEHNLG